MRPRQPAREPLERAPSHGSTSSTTPTYLREASTLFIDLRLRVARHPLHARGRRRHSRSRMPLSTGCTARRHKRLLCFDIRFEHTHCDGGIHTLVADDRLFAFNHSLSRSALLLHYDTLYLSSSYFRSMYAFFASLNSMWLYLSAAFGKLFGWLLLSTFFDMGTQNRLHTLIPARILSIKMAFYISNSRTWAHGDTDVKSGRGRCREA